MGNYATKLLSHHSEIEMRAKCSSNTSTCESEKPNLCTPPISRRKLTTDPRSATLGIDRTPIEVACTPPAFTRRVASALPKYLQGKRYLETDFDAAMPVTVTPDKCIPDPRSPNITQQRTPIIVKSLRQYVSPVVTVIDGPDMTTPEIKRMTALSLDPRSPALDFDRTPILKPKTIDHPLMEDLAVDAADRNVYSAKLSFCETTTADSIPEIQTVAENMPTINESLSLDDRIDLCCEDSCDNSISSGRTSSVEELSDGSISEEQVTVIRNTKILSPWSDALSTWTDCKPDEAVEEIIEKKIETDDKSVVKTIDDNISDIINAVMKNSISEMKSVMNNDKIKVWRDSVSPDIPDDNENRNQKPTEEILIEFDDDIISKTPKKSNVAKIIAKGDDDKGKSQTKKKKSQQQQLKGDKKIGMEEKKVFNIENGKNIIDATKNRTPLANRSNNHKQLSTAKSPQQILRTKGLSARTIYHENTPPHTERFVSKTKPNGIQWDADTTVLI